MLLLYSTAVQPDFFLCLRHSIMDTYGDVAIPKTKKKTQDEFMRDLSNQSVGVVQAES